MHLKEDNPLNHRLQRPPDLPWNGYRETQIEEKYARTLQLPLLVRRCAYSPRPISTGG